MNKLLYNEIVQNKIDEYIGDLQIIANEILNNPKNVRYYDLDEYSLSSFKNVSDTFFRWQSLNEHEIKEYYIKVKRSLKGIIKKSKVYAEASDKLNTESLIQLNRLHKVINYMILFIDEEILNNKDTNTNIDNKSNKTTIDMKQNLPNGLENKIVYNNNIKELAYLFYMLKNENIIEVDNLGATLSKIFTDSNKKPIINKTFNNYFNDFKNRDYPSKANDIDKFIKSIKKAN